MARKSLSRHPNRALTEETYRAAKKAEFLKVYEALGAVIHSAERVGIARSTIVEWRKNDEAFDIACDQAYAKNTELLETTLLQRALRGTSKGADSLGMFFLKKRNPDYRDQLQINSKNVNLNHNVQHVPQEVRDVAKGLSKELLKKIAEGL